MPIHDELGTRMKEFYESVPKTKLMRRTPVAIRIDGKAFHTFTRGFSKPFDDVLISAMQDTMKYLCKNIQGCVLGYTQSDEITLILVDYKRLNSSAWFDYEVQKMCSIAASMATMAFNKAFNEGVRHRNLDYYAAHATMDNPYPQDDLGQTYAVKAQMGAMFDARCFNIPKEEVTNLVYWRQLDATRNSIQMVGQANFSHKELQGKSCEKIKEMLITEKGISWENFHPMYKHGSCCIKVTTETDGVTRSSWEIDKNIPLFVGEEREYIESLIQCQEE
jgi:tRNA(His) 5'-end guanylyltransferase